MRKLHIRQLRHSAGALLMLRLEWLVLTDAEARKQLTGRDDADGWQRILPQIPNDQHGFERQCVAGLQFGIEALHGKPAIERREVPLDARPWFAEELGL